MNAMKLPTWLRVVLVAGVFVLATGAALFAYHWYNKPVTLTIAVGSLDGEAGKVMSAIAARLVAMNAPVRLKAIETGSALEAAKAFSSGTADLAVVRGDVGDLSQAQAVIVVAKAVVLLIAPPGSPISDVPGLKRRTVGVVGGEINQKVVDVLSREYDLAKANVTFKIYSSRATRIDLYLYAAASGSQEKTHLSLSKGTGNIWSTTVPVSTLTAAGITGTIYYGYRAWGPNWTYNSGWTKGSREHVPARRGDRNSNADRCRAMRWASACASGSSSWWRWRLPSASAGR